MAEEISRHKDMKMSWCSGSQALQVVWIMGSVGGGLRDETGGLDRARQRKKAHAPEGSRTPQNGFKQGIDVRFTRQACGGQLGCRTKGRKTG